jgi:large subunit ribosomal protein L15
MMIHDITAKAGAHRKRKRVGRGEGGGRGKQSGRGNKGAGSRSGTTRRAAFEGGQMPLFRRLRKYGFSNAKFRTDFWIVNLVDIVEHPAFAKGGEVSLESLMKAGLIRDDSLPLKILGDMGKTKTLAVKLTIKANRVSASARKAVEAAGGKVDEIGTRKDIVRGIDRNTGDLTPVKQTKKLKDLKKRQAAKVAAAAPKAEKAEKAEKAPKAEKADKPAKAPKPAKGE